MDGNRHYIRVVSGNIVNGFSDAFEQPQGGDICINENGGRHFGIEGQINPPLFTVDGIYLYRFSNGMVIPKTQAEIDAESAALPAPPPTEEDKLRSDVDYLLIAELTREGVL